MLKTIASLLMACVLVGCAAMYTQSPLEKSATLNPGMTRSQVQEIMGSPVKSEFSGNQQAWHYCKTGASVDEFVVMLFNDGVLEELKNYYVTSKDVGGARGDCSKFTKRVEFRPADSVKEIRVR